MKRYALLFFIIVIATLTVLPTARPRAQKRDKEKAPTRLPIARELLMKECKMRDAYGGTFDANSYARELSRQTRDIASSLPAPKSAERPVLFSAKARGVNAAAETYANIIDKEIFGVLEARNIEPAALASDEELCRRIFLDLTGRQPSPERLLKYVSDRDTQKREKLIAELIASPAFVDRWTNWMGDLTRNFAVALDGSARDRNAQYKYLRDAIEENKPINKVASEIITYNGRYDEGPGGFLVRPIFGTEIEQDAYDEIAAEVSRTFLGTQMVCISCHDGAGHLEQVNLYFTGKRRQEYWGMAAFFAQTEFQFTGRALEFVRIRNNREGQYVASTRNGMRPPRTGGEIEPSYLFGEGKPRNNEERRNALARLITSDAQFARAFVNRVFAHFFTLGLVEPLDGFDLARLDPNNPPPEPWTLQPSNPQLLNALAKSFQESGYDLRALITLITSSQAYALSSRYDEAKWKEEYAPLYARKLVRRLQAEEVLDAITASTFRPGTYTARGFDKPFSSTMALPGVEEPTFGGRQSDDPFTVQRFLQNFGRGDRNTIPRSNNSSISQALALFNSEMIIGRLKSEQGLPNQLHQVITQAKASPEEAVAYLYLITISRLPSAAEMEALKPLIQRGPETIADLQWALFNRPDFLYNY